MIGAAGRAQLLKRLEVEGTLAELSAYAGEVADGKACLCELSARLRAVAEKHAPAERRAIFAFFEDRLLNEMRASGLW